jgi:NitT/TauT family transport system substrate-binding protein
MPAPVSRRATFALPAVLAAMSIVPAPQAAADDKVLKVGTLKLIHGISVYFYEKFAPAGYTVEVYPFESPTDGKNAVLTGTVDTCIHGIAAFLLGAAAGEPVALVANANNGGMAVMAGVNTDIKSIKDLKGKRVAIWPGSTQEAVILERLRMEGMSIKDIQPIRLQFSDHPAALARGDIDAYVGAEPGPGISLANGTGRLVEYPYSTPIGSLNMILSASEKAVKENPERIRMIVDMHRKAVDYAMASPPLIVDMAMAKLGQQKKSIELAVPNVELAWKLDDVFMQRANAYARLMFENKQIRQVPDLNRHITKQFIGRSFWSFSAPSIPSCSTPSLACARWMCDCSRPPPCSAARAPACFARSCSPPRCPRSSTGFVSLTALPGF